DLMGPDDRGGVQRRRAHRRLLVVADPARRDDRHRDARVHHVRLRAGRGAQPEAPPAMTVLSLRDLHITYHTLGGGVPAVRGVDLDVSTSEVLGLAGESGCGKSTIAAAIL